ncbi:MAG: hypothetical protein K1X56_01030 [Flavobacteriales bacterium]|nr:hypothetical protein [Flavobacteriales bacterium]
MVRESNTIKSTDYYDAIRNNASFQFSWQWMFLLVGFICLFFSLHIFHPEDALGWTSIAPLGVAVSFLALFIPIQFRPWVQSASFILTSILLIGINPTLILLGFISLSLFILILKINGLFKLIYFGFIILLFLITKSSAEHWLSISVVMPFFGVMFMFRGISFYYENSIGKIKSPWIIKWNYFAMIPNLFFFLFPIIDYRKFTGNYYSVPVFMIWKSALRHLALGLFYYILYRWINLSFINDPIDVIEASLVVKYFFFGFALSLRMVGIFYIGLALIECWGYQYEDVFGNYFSAHSFTNLWQKINVFWREFMLRIFYYPLYFRIKNYFSSEAFRIGLTIAIVFLLSAFLHTWQQFWISGNFVIRLTDLVFWMTFGFGIAFDAIRSLKKRKEKQWLNDIKAGLLLVFISFFYGLWTSGDIKEWLYLISLLTVNPGAAIWWLSIIIFAVILFRILFRTILFRINLKSNFITLALVIFIGGLSTTAYFTEEKTGYSDSLITDITNPHKLNKRDKKRIERGYYGKILDTDDLKRKIAVLQTGEDWNPHNYLTRETGNELFRELIPDTSQSFKGTEIYTNSYGLRDKAYELKKTPNTYRIALMGGSYEMGSGVNQEQDFESRIELQLNANYPEKKWEIWNFGLGGYGLIQTAFLCKHKVQEIQPDLIIYIAHSGELDRIAGDITFLLRKKVDFTLEKVNSYILSCGIESGMPDLQKEQLLRKSILLLYCELLNEIINQQKFLFVYLPTLGEQASQTEFQQLSECLLIPADYKIDLSEVYNNDKISDLYLSPWDNHPNEKGHEVIAKLLYHQIQIVFKKQGIIP